MHTLKTNIYMDEETYQRELGHSHRYIYFLIVSIVLILLFLILVVSYATRKQSVYSHIEKDRQSVASLIH